MSSLTTKAQAKPFDPLHAHAVTLHNQIYPGTDFSEFLPQDQDIIDLELVADSTGLTLHTYRAPSYVLYLSALRVYA